MLLPLLWWCYCFSLCWWIILWVSGLLRIPNSVCDSVDHQQSSPGGHGVSVSAQHLCHHYFCCSFLYSREQARNKNTVDNSPLIHVFQYNAASPGDSSPSAWQTLLKLNESTKDRSDIGHISIRCWERNDNVVPWRVINWPIMASVIVSMLISPCSRFPTSHTHTHTHTRPHSC